MTSTKFPCGVCSKPVASNHNALCCDSCDKWVHIKCNFLNKKTYQKLQNDKTPWFCINCVKEQLPFQSQVNIVQNRQYVTLDKHATLKELLENLDFDEDCPNSEYYTPRRTDNFALDISFLNTSIYSP